MKGKSPFRGIHLMGRNPDIKQYSIHLIYVQRASDLFHLRKITLANNPKEELFYPWHLPRN